MNRFTFENQGTNTCLVLRLTGLNIDENSLKMITNNKIPGLAPAVYTQQDDELLVKYNISSHIALPKFFAGTVNKKRLLGVFSGIVTAFNSAQEYMLDLNSILLEQEYIFADTVNSSVRMICIPVSNIPERKCDYREFFKQMMFSTQFDQTEDCLYVARIINYLNGTGSFVTEKFGKLLNELDSMTGYLIRPEHQAEIGSKKESTTILNEDKPDTMQRQKETELLHEDKLVDDKSGKSEEQNVPVNREPEDISLMYLIQHYSKENAAQYKKQKEAKKQAKKDGKIKKKQEKKTKKGTQLPKKMEIPNRPLTKPGGMEIPSGEGLQKKEDAVSKQEKQETPIWGSKSAGQDKSPQIKEGENFGETTYLISSTADKTTVLAASQKISAAAPYLIRTRNGEKVELNRDVFCIGTERSYAHYRISDNKAVSRSHANFVVREGICYVVDNHSTNHTYINGSIIPAHVETVLKDGDMVCLANEEFQFKKG